MIYKKLLPLVLFSVLISCQSNSDKKANAQAAQDVKATNTSHQYFGELISPDNYISAQEVATTLASLQDTSSDTLSLKVKGKVKEVCQAKGCWMRVQIAEEEVMVKFKDYGFFVPKDIAGKEVVLQGNLFSAITDVETLKHLAKDGGKSESEIAEITKPKKELSFVSDGVIVLDNAPETP